MLVLVLVPADTPDPAARATEAMRRYWISDLADKYDDNPEAKCDGFTIGGRYDGIMWGKQQHYNLSPTEFQARYGFDVVEDDDNIRPVSALVPPEEMRVGAIVTPDGAWHEWESTETWDDRARALLAAHEDCLAVAFDIHF
jgi:hypothetical protein